MTTSQLHSNTTGFSDFFPKRTYNFKVLAQHILGVIRNFSSIQKTMKSGSLPKPFSERIMLATTAVNGCVLCEWAHTAWAAESGCSDDEIRGILDSDLSCAPDEEIAALTFAQYYAHTQENPSREALKQLIKTYGLSATNEILTHIRMISIGNLSGNTAEAFKSRINGKPPKEGNGVLEFLFFFFASPMLKQMNAAR